MAVAAMGDGQNKTLHSFFTKPNVTVQTQLPPTDPSLDDNNPSPQPDRDPEVGAGAGAEDAPKTRAKATPKTNQDAESAEGQSNTRRKRRKLSLTEQSHVGAHPPEHVLPNPPSQTQPPSPHHDPVNPQSIPTQGQEQPTAQSKTPPKKMLKLSAGGTLVSPTSKSSAVKEGPEPKKPAKRGRPRKEKHRIVVCRYAQEGGLGHRIDRILEGAETFSLPNPASRQNPPKSKPVEPGPKKPPHPFFSGKPKEPTQNLRPPTTASGQGPQNLSNAPRRPSAVTPGKLRAQARENASSKTHDSANIPQFGSNRDRRIVKHPGMVEAPFPPKGFAHVRGDFYYHTDYARSTVPATAVNVPSRMKQKTPVTGSSEDILTRYKETLDYTQKDTPRLDGFYDPPASLRVPSRHLISGAEIQLSARNQLRAPPSAHASSEPYIHPACRNLYHSIPNTLTPFDEGRSETQIWAQKFSPKLASEVLQIGKEAMYLKDWMRALTITAVETSSSQITKVDKKDQDRKPRKKRRKKATELDGFIVDDVDLTDDGSDELIELENRFPLHDGRPQKRSLVRGTRLEDPANRAKISNSVIVSGPPGCGKTAMVYAAAKELGFEIFEINPGSRRSGKDVLDKIGDMVENHLVQNNSADAGNVSADEDAGRLADAFNKDLESGRQGTMKSFFKAKSKAANPPPKKKEVDRKPKLDLNQAQKVLSTSKPSRGQKQSLILLEEVDVMFEEDKNFWQTVFTLLQTSKRPVIMTCNDEDLVPIQAINFQAILRLCVPPTDLAVDYLVLMAAREGHMLDRDAVSMLFDSKRHDLRASIADLQLWCQMGVGDPRGGLGWLFQRWPHGSGVDEHGKAIRIASKHTYQAGMGLVTYYPETDGTHDEELLAESWETWGIDPREKLFSQLAEEGTANTAFDDPQARLTALKRFSCFSDSLSAIDVSCRVALPGNDNVLLDPTQPELPVKTRSNYIHGMPLLETPHMMDCSAFDKHLAVASCRLASHAFSSTLDTSLPSILYQISNSHAPASKSHPLDRADFSSALDTLAPAPALGAQYPLSHTVLDGSFHSIATDIAPYVRSIAAYDLALESQRARLHGSVAPSGVPSKRARTTRAARSALEGGKRQLTRRERWFDADLDLGLVLSTAGDWPRFEAASIESEGQSPDQDIEMDVA